MDKKEDRAGRWLYAATRGIRFGPDREAVSRELREHLEDKTADLRRIFPGITEEEAEKRAMASMGDAEEIGRELARVHRPWLGYLWRASQILLGVAALFTVIIGANAVVEGRTGWYRESSGLDLASEDKLILEARVLEPDGERAEVEGYTISMTEAVFLHYKQLEGTEFKTEYRELHVILRTWSPFFWDREGWYHRHITAVDSLGNEYASHYEYNRTSLKVTRGNVFSMEDGHGPFHQDDILQVKMLPPEAEWVRLEYDWMGRSFSMTVDLTEEAGK